MSHNTTIKVSYKNREALKRAAAKTGAEIKTGNHTVQLFAGSQSCDLSIKLPGWNYPVAVTGDQAVYDNYQGNWGDIREMEKLGQAYATEIAMEEMAAASLSYDSTQVLQDGSVELVFNTY